MTDGNGNETVTDQVGELAREIRRVIDDNRRFLDRVMADDFDDAEVSDPEPETPEEEL